jgi:hypothetical protein
MRISWDDRGKEEREHLQRHHIVISVPRGALDKRTYHSASNAIT